MDRFKLPAVRPIVCNLSCPLKLLDKELKTTVYDLLVKVRIESFSSLFCERIYEVPANDGEAMGDPIPLSCKLHAVVCKKDFCHCCPSFFNLKKIMAVVKKPLLEFGMA